MKAKIKNLQPEKVSAETLDAIKEAVQVEIETRYDSLYKTISKEGVIQTLVTVLHVLEIQYNWSERQIKEFKDNVFELFELLAHPTGLAKNLDVDLIEKHIIEKYNINIREDLSIDLDNKKNGGISNE